MPPTVQARDSIDRATRQRAIQAAQGKEPFDLLLTNATIVDVITGELREADLGLVGPMIASVHPPGLFAEARQTHDLTGRFLAPGLIDTHVHFESSHMLPHHYASVVVPQGTTTIFYDPHELANVMGVAGVRFAVDCCRGLPLRCLCQAPSSVPSAPGLEVSGASFGGAEMREMLRWPEVIGVAEMMDMNGVLSGSGRMVEIAEEGRAARKLVEGHARGLTGPRLQAYCAAGIGSDHEITSGDDLLEKLRAGLAIEIRGSHDYVMPPVVEALAKLPHLSSQIMICTDDVPPDHLLAHGGVIDVLRRFIRYGMRPLDALRFATFNAALHLGRADLGALCASRIADVLVLSDLATLAVDRVYVAGELAAQNGGMLHPVEAPQVALPGSTIHISLRTEDDFALRVPNAMDGQARLRTIDGVRFSQWSEAIVPVIDGRVMLPDDADLNFLFVQHRHGAYDAKPHVALQSGLPQLKGALATTYLHDSHNLFVIGGNARDMAVAANALIACGGGIAAVQDGKVVSIAEFPIAGMLSAAAPAEVARAFEAVRAAAGTIAPWKLPYWIFKTLEGMSLACNPFPYLTDLGLIDGLKQEFMEIVLK